MSPQRDVQELQLEISILDQHNSSLRIRGRLHRPISIPTRTIGSSLEPISEKPCNHCKLTVTGTDSSHFEVVFENFEDSTKNGPATLTPKIEEPNKLQKLGLIISGLSMLVSLLRGLIWLMNHHGPLKP